MPSLVKKNQDEDMEDDLDFLDKSGKWKAQQMIKQHYWLCKLSDILKSRTRGKRLDSYAENLKKLRGIVTSCINEAQCIISHLY